MYDVSVLIKPEYVKMCDSIKATSQETYFGRLSSLLFNNILRDGSVDLINKGLKTKIGATLVSSEILKEVEVHHLMQITKGNGDKILLYFVNEWVIRDTITLVQMEECVSEVQLVLPHQQPLYRPNTRYIIDKIFRDGQIARCTDIHLEPVSDFNGGYKYRISYRKGIYMKNITSDYDITPRMVDEIIEDLIKNRSRSAFKAVDPHTEVRVSFGLIDPLYLVRCEVARTIGGSLLVIRLLPNETPFRIQSLGFSRESENALMSIPDIPSGLSLVSGVIGSGKGTTVNAVALEIRERNQYSLISVDQPIEYLGDFPQIEYMSAEQLYQVCNSVKKLDRNFVLLNEIATQETARQVYNLVVSGVHVITTIHNNRVHRLMYKLSEMLGPLYTNLIPYLNLISYQDKFSITCECLQKIDKSHYSDDADAVKFLDFLGLDVIEQPTGCSVCNKTKIIDRGIQVVSEHIFFGAALKEELLRADVHDQAVILKRAMKSSVNLEDIVCEKLRTGKILFNEAISKLDTWR